MLYGAKDIPRRRRGGPFTYSERVDAKILWIFKCRRTKTIHIRL